MIFWISGFLPTSIPPTGESFESSYKPSRRLIFRWADDLGHEATPLAARAAAQSRHSSAAAAAPLRGASHAYRPSWPRPVGPGAANAVAKSHPSQNAPLG